MNKVLIKNAQIVNEGIIVKGDVFIENDFIFEIGGSISAKTGDTQIIEANGKYLIPGMIDDQ
ncbi:MAG: dihydroorotase, partial [Flavobacteriaceae bacterium]|nr:dihydroorotase [Flavobacteriaceae bacterium]